MPEIVTDLVSTVIPVYNRPTMLRAAVASVLAQTWRPIEILISDDGSTDETGEIGLHLASEHAGIIRYVHNPNRGPGPAREAGRVLARGEYLQYLDSDDRLLPQKFECQVNLLKARPECDVAYGMTRLVDGDGQVLAAPFKWTGQERDSLFPGLLVDRWWCTHTPLYRRSLTDRIGSWTNLRYSQDWEYDARAGGLGARVVNCGEYVSEHVQHVGERQTGGGKWLSPAERVRFFRSLHQQSEAAGVSRASPEMRHFSRWVFRHAREMALFGAAREASDLLSLALRAAPNAVDARVYLIASRTLGWGRVARWSESIRALSGKGAGSATRKQSWME